jgi:branched-chain amino acid transport system ATP-binding protein
MSEVLLEVAGLRAGYGSLAVVRGLDVTVNPSEVVGLLGANGAGKTTTVLTVSSLLPALGGEVSVLGRKLTGVTKAYETMRNGLGLVPDNRALFPSLTALQHFRLALERPGWRAEVKRVLGVLPELEPLLSRRVGLMSGGEQQMVAMARVLVRRPALLIVDEMSLGLAPLVARRLGKVVRQLAEEEGLGVLIVEQHFDLAVSMADWLVVLDHGEPAMSGSRDEVKAEYERVVHSYLGEDLSTTG